MITMTVEPVTGGKAEKFTIEENSLSYWKFLVDAPKDTAARSRDIAIGMTVRGFIIPGFAGTAGDSTYNLAAWTSVSSDSTDAYRKITIDGVSAGNTVRHFEFPCAYVSHYKEDFSGTNGDGSFEITFRQRRGSVWNADSTVSLNFKGYEFKDEGDAAPAAK